ncbi:ABC transporter permease subunit [Anaerobranca gottschalkii]|uniref:ABC-type transport system involved in multi-copper enzyme maturation, permease component n=1 Tax=Anaerobranca gottschalkii DSM 13577 TaxID=1120990 RepID=A0A1I0AQH4_9FIRM|nr:ABC transporter permease subunit [Anaerobranca gottschalkii]SES96647.1 ABC-type transport system involved in multi-copper enzyme maturation, permease component [Anaerobranca gottschalkii DSM 13577]
MPNLLFELKKVLKNKKILVIILVSLMISSLNFCWNYINMNWYGVDLFNRIFEISLEISESRNTYQKLMTDAGLTPHEIRRHMVLFTEMENSIRKFEQYRDNRHKFRYEIPKQMLAFYEAYEKYSEDRQINANGRQFFHLYRGDIERLNLEKAFFQELVDKGLPYEDPNFSLSGANLLKNLIDTIFGNILIILLIFILVDIFSGEKTSGGEKLRLIQPVKRKNILVAKIITSFILVLLLLFSTMIFTYLFALLFGDGFGSMAYPLQKYYSLEKVGVSIGEYLSLGILYYILYILFIISCIALLTTIFKETSIVAVCTIFITILGAMTVPREWKDYSLLLQGLPIIGEIPEVKPINYMNPFTYQQFERLILGLDKSPLILLGIMVFYSIALLFLTCHLSKVTLIQNFSLTFKIKDGEESLKKIEKQKNYPLPYFRFELLKIFKRKTTTIPYFLVFIFVLGYGLMMVNSYEKLIDNERVFYNSQALQYAAFIEETERRLEDNNLEREIVEGLLRSKEKYIREYNNNIRAANAFLNRDIDEMVEMQKYFLITHSDIMRGGYPLQARAVFLEKLDEIKERKVQPILSNGLLFWVATNSPFANEISLTNKLEFDIVQPSITYIINSLFKNKISILLLVVFAISFFWGFSDETHDTNTMFLLNIQPINKKRIYFGKIFAQIIAFLVMIGIILGGLFITLKIAGSPVEGNFPAVQYINQIDENYEGITLNRRLLIENRGRKISARDANKLMGITFRNMSEQNWELVVLFALTGLVIIAFATLLSLKIKNKFLVSLVTILVFAMGFFLSRYILRRYSILLPFIWLDQPLVATGIASMIFNLNFLNSFLGIFVLTVWFTLFVYWGYREFNKQWGRG